MVVVAAGCFRSPAPTKPATAPPVKPVPLATDGFGCSEAAVGIERGTRGLRPPDMSIVNPMRSSCISDVWSLDAIDCFAKMNEGELGKCATKLDETSRERLFVALGGGYDDRAMLVAAHAKLATLQLGVSECDRFVVTVTRALACEGMTIEERVELGRETADMWSLPTSNLSTNVQQRMAQVCGKSLAALRQQVVDAGCMP